MKRLNLILTTNSVILSLALGFCLFVTSGCEREDLDSSKELGALVLKLDLVSNSEVVVKSVTTESSADELEIFDGYIFIFSELGVYNRHYTFTDANITANTTKNPTITIEEGTKIADGHKLVLIFNQSTSEMVFDTYTNQTIGDAFVMNGGLVDGATAAEVRWKQPMFGGVENWSDVNQPTIFVTRSMAKVQLKLHENLAVGSGDGVGAINFADVTKVKYKIYQYASKGNIDAGISGALNTIDDGFAEAVDVAVDADIVNDVTKTVTEASNSTGASYIYEFDYSVKTIGATPTVLVNTLPNYKRLAIIVKANDRFYRLDLNDRSQATGAVYLDVERNHHYQIVITKVVGNGYATATDALRMPPSNIDYLVLSSDGYDTAGYGQYLLSVKNRYDNYICDNEARITMEAMYALGSTVSGDHQIEMPDDLLAKFTLVSNVNVSGGDLTVEPAVGRLTDQMSTITWKVNCRKGGRDIPGQAAITVKIAYGNVSVTKTVNVSLMGAPNCYAVYVKAIPPSVDVPTWSYVDWNSSLEHDHLNQAELLRFSLNGTVFTLPENTTPTSWVLGDGTPSTADVYASIPRFTVRTFKGEIVTYAADNTPSYTFLDIEQQVPYYIGRSGTEITAANANLDAEMGDELSSDSDRKYKRLIAGSIDEQRLGNGSPSIRWGAKENYFEYHTTLPAKPLAMNGWAITEDMRINHASTGVAGMHCWRRNGNSVDAVLNGAVSVWYLPALNQLIDLYDVKRGGGAHNFRDYVSYWSSSEQGVDNAWQVDMTDGAIGDNSKTNYSDVRCVREL